MQPWVYLVLLGVCIILYAYLRPQRNDTKQVAVVNDIETALDQFADELEEGNKELMASVQGLKRELEAEINKLNGRLTVLERQSRDVLISDSQNEHSNVQSPEQPVSKKIKMTKVSPESQVNEEAFNLVEQPVSEVKQQTNDIKNRYGTIFELYEQGKSMEYISKKIGMNKGEIQLIIQLARQEEQFRA